MSRFTCLDCEKLNSSSCEFMNKMNENKGKVCDWVEVDCINAYNKGVDDFADNFIDALRYYNKDVTIPVRAVTDSAKRLRERLKEIDENVERREV